MNVTITEATINDIDEIIKLKKDVWNRMKNKNWYVINGTNKDFLFLSLVIIIFLLLFLLFIVLI